MARAYIGMGANLASPAGRPEATLTAAAARLESLGRVTRRSSLYRTAPVGFADQPDFVNAVVELETGLDPRELLEQLLAIEREFGRSREGAVQNGPRTLDLDLLLYDEVISSEPGLVLPHPRLSERTFVLIPLCEIAPEIFPAGHARSVSQYLHEIVHEIGGNDSPVQKTPWVLWRASGVDAGDSEPVGAERDGASGSGDGACAGSGASPRKG